VKHILIVVVALAASAVTAPAPFARTAGCARGSDDMMGPSGADVIGGGGDDTIAGGAGPDDIRCGLGDDTGFADRSNTVDFDTRETVLFRGS